MTVAGEIDMLTAVSLRQTLGPLAADPTVRVLVCDLSRVTFFGCAGATALLDVRETVRQRGASLRLVAQTYVVLRPLTVMGLLDVLPVSADVRSALS